MSARRDVIRTKKLIEKAYYDLMFQKEDNRITVQDILDEAILIDTICDFLSGGLGKLFDVT